jgi:hypothetical protein
MKQGAAQDGAAPEVARAPTKTYLTPATVVEPFTWR